MPGLDRTILDSINVNLAAERIQRDLQTDFILAPHYNIIFLKAIDELWARARELLASGKYSPELALTVAVPKPNGFTRPGSILVPIDRIIYQALADMVAPILEGQLDRSRSFSHVVVQSGSGGRMFESERTCWYRLQDSLRKLASKGGYFVKADVANYFERIPQHHLINLMTASGCPTEIVRFLEEMFLAFQERDSFGIVQGIFPSDLFGNFYLSDIDAYCDMNGIPSARFVDDLYLRFESLPKARRGLMHLIDQLRREGLHLNEFKSGIRSADQLIRDETELDQLFSNTLKKVKREREQAEESGLGYGFVAEWELEEGYNDEESGDEESDDELTAAAVHKLYESMDDNPGQADKIERFCLPLLRATGSNIGIKRALNGVKERPHLARLYLSYLSRFISDDTNVKQRLEKLLGSPVLVSDHQRMYLLGALMSAKGIKQDSVNTALRMLSDSQIGQDVRALAAIFSARHGTPQQRRAVRLTYEKEAAPYVRAAILYSSRHFTGPERRSCIKAWGGHSSTNALIAHALQNS